MTVVDRVAASAAGASRAAGGARAAAAATARSRLTMASPVYRDSDAQFVMTVTAVRDLGHGLRRITFSANEFGDFRVCGADEYFGLVFPRGGAELTLPDPGENVRAAIAEMPDDVRPGLRWYTVRSQDPAASTIDVDIVTHGDSGPGSAWACTARVGDRVGFRSGGALYRGHECDGRLLLVADETALPALAAILETHPADADRATIHVELPDEGMLTAYPVIAGTDVTVHRRTDGIPGSALLPALRADAATRGLRDVEYAWACGESGLVTETRRHLVKAVGLDRHSVLFSGYWKLGQERG
ncbi:NADPH-dependent ferric siderophore reductase [Knoellia remsis]|uniref:NADPH-dependent ferric siderophore reductase n=1 Tax=Knoellia remsis TaxID=407159 RepID=A0A2T0UCI7_9MICO|nr:siderophore-interacting protein [Knoellia remsis]PRY55656.1 NADPH-dependent ferric siderophore reductase [Knoellia remsis]